MEYNKKDIGAMISRLERINNTYHLIIGPRPIDQLVILTLDLLLELAMLDCNLTTHKVVDRINMVSNLQLNMMTSNNIFTRTNCNYKVAIKAMLSINHSLQEGATIKHNPQTIHPLAMPKEINCSILNSEWIKASRNLPTGAYYYSTYEGSKQTRQDLKGNIRPLKVSSPYLCLAKTQGGI